MKFRYCVVDSVFGNGRLHVEKLRQPVYKLEKRHDVHYVCNSAEEATDWAIEACKKRIDHEIETIVNLNRLKQIYRETEEDKNES